ncbi:MAG: PilW family protein [Burkholderiaceae bacterium]|nr:PilW family protein [Burkholderiaceae bacterium]
MNSSTQLASSGGWRTAKKQRGLTLVELMVSIVLGLMVVLAATALLVSSKSSYTTQDDESVVRDAGRYALENITRSVRQSAFVNLDTETVANSGTLQAPITMTSTMSANLKGYDGKTLISDSSATLTDSDVTSDGVVNGSDVLAVRFFGVGNKTTGSINKDGYGSIVDCAGFGVSAPTSQTTADADRGWSIYYVAKDATGEPQLRCKYRGESSKGYGWSSESIVRGVESFQVLYGVDTDNDKIPNQYLTATQIDALDAAAAKDNPGKTLNEYTYWKKVVVIKVALLMRGEKNVQGDTSTMVFDLFGKAYSDANASNDTGSHIEVSKLDAQVKKRVRKLFETTIQYRNSATSSNTQ